MYERIESGEDPANRFREEIDRLFRKDVRRVVEIPGVDLVEELSNKDPRRYNNCSCFLIGTSTTKGIEEEVIAKGRETDFEVGAIAVYFDESGSILHIGRVCEDGYIISKWGPSGHVYRHKPWLVPSNYGTKIRCFVVC